MARKRRRKVKGFKRNAAAIARRQGISRKRANKILGAATARNPKLRKRAAAGRKRAAAKRRRRRK
jgi:hypothetical protein